MSGVRGAITAGQSHRRKSPRYGPRSAEEQRRDQRRMDTPYDCSVTSGRSREPCGFTFQLIVAEPNMAFATFVLGGAVLAWPIEQSKRCKGLATRTIEVVRGRNGG